MIHLIEIDTKGQGDPPNSAGGCMGYQLPENPEGGEAGGIRCQHDMDPRELQR